MTVVRVLSPTAESMLIRVSLPAQPGGLRQWSVAALAVGVELDVRIVPVLVPALWPGDVGKSALLAPDIYLDDFRAVCAEYTQNGNPLFIPEASRDEQAGLRAMYALGHHHALGFAPFGIDSLSQTNRLRDYYAVLGSLLPLIAQHQGKDTLKGFLQYKDEKGVEFDLGDFRAEIEYRSQEGNRPGGGVAIAVAPNTFVMTGANYSIRFASRPDRPANSAWLAIDELVAPGPERSSFSAKKTRPLPGLDLVLARRLNGDEASYRVNLGPKPRILLGRVYRF